MKNAFASEPPPSSKPKFMRCTAEDLGFYLIVDAVYWLEKLLPVGVKTCQLRIKDKRGPALEEEIKKGIAVAKAHDARLFINDYWELAIAHDAYGVHLGQEDLNGAHCDAIAQAGLRLGISTHDEQEIARALAIQPSYIAYGPIFETTSKKMRFAPQGIENLKKCRERLASYPLVAIGGISLERAPAVLACGVEGMAVISAVLHDREPEKAAALFLNLFDPLSAERRNHESHSF